MGKEDDSTEVGCVYLVKYGNMVKVGMTNNPEARLRTLQTGVPEQIAMVWVCVFNSREAARKLEKAIHRHLRDRWVRGEWFRIDVEAAIEAAERKVNLMVPIAMRKKKAKIAAQSVTQAVEWAESGKLEQMIREQFLLPA